MDEPEDVADAGSQARPEDGPRDGGRRDDEPGALLPRLRVIEDQPLETRAEALAQLHEELRAQLEAGDATRPHA